MLHFRPRRSAAQQPAHAASAPSDQHDDESVDDLARFEEEPEDDNYRRRMLMNVIAVAIVTLLVGLGVWLADTIAAMEKDQDCVIQGRANCSPIDATAPKK